MTIQIFCIFCSTAHCGCFLHCMIRYFESWHRDFLRLVITINATVVYMAGDIMILMQTNPLSRTIGRSRPWKSRLFWALKWQLAKRVPFGSKKVKIFRAPPTSSNLSSKKTGTLVFLCTRVLLVICILYSVYCISVFCILYYVFCILYSIFFILYSVFCEFYDHDHVKGPTPTPSPSPSGTKWIYFGPGGGGGALPPPRPLYRLLYRTI